MFFFNDKNMLANHVKLSGFYTEKEHKPIML